MTYQEPKSAFYKATNFIYLENKLAFDKVVPWIKRQFAKSKLIPNGEVLKSILDLTQYHPYYIQKICFQVWLNNFNPRSRKKHEISMEKYRESLKDLLKEEKVNFQERLDKLTQNQKLVITALAKKDSSESITTKKVIEKYSLPTKASVISSLKSLSKEINPLIYEDQDYGYKVEDPFFELWLKTLA